MFENKSSNVEYEIIAPEGSATYDIGLRAFMRKVYNNMSLALLISALSAFITAIIPGLLQTIMTHKILFYIVAFAPVIYLFAVGGKIMTMTSGAAKRSLVIFSAIMGVSLSYILVVFTGASIVQTFLITACIFLSMSLYGYTTKKDLSGMGSFLMMGFIGIFFASILNLLFKSGAMSFIINIMAVIIFTGLAAWENQKLKMLYQANHTNSETTDKIAVIGALNLYMSFINLFMSLLSLFGDRRS